MRCIICNSNDWENVDEIALIKPLGMSICKCCGFVSYPSLWKSKEEIFAYYKKDYRPAPNFGNFSTCNRKNYFHANFLQDILTQWRDDESKQIDIFEVGAAYGMSLKLFKDLLPKANVCGSELTTSFVRNAYHEFGIKLIEEFDDRPCDLIMSYKVAEHQLDVDVELRRYAKALKPGGYLYISIPTWFDSMTNFGEIGFDLHKYYDTNHINVWTIKLFETLLHNTGFEVVKKDHKIYGSTYLCTPVVGEIVEKKDYENPDDIKEKMKKIKKAFELFNENKYNDAIAVWPDYPLAHVNRFEHERKKAYEIFKSKGWEELKKQYIDFAIESCPNSFEIIHNASDICMRFEKFDLAIQYCLEGLKIKPETPAFLMNYINIVRELGVRAKTKEDKNKYFTLGQDLARHLASVSPEHKRQAVDILYLLNAETEI